MYLNRKKRTKLMATYKFVGIYEIPSVSKAPYYAKRFSLLLLVGRYLRDAISKNYTSQFF